MERMLRDEHRDKRVKYDEENKLFAAWGCFIDELRTRGVSVVCSFDWRVWGLKMRRCNGSLGGS